jgi:hypothetical protein
MTLRNLKTEPLPTYGDHYTLEEFVKRCQDGSFIDYDGYGNYATKTEMFDKIVYPSDVTKKNFKPKPEFTHVVWFNR